MSRTLDMEPLDKEEVIDLTNMMFRFQMRSGAAFKIEEYGDCVFILTDINKLTRNDVASFHKKNRYICNKIWFTQISASKKLVNAYEDCPRNRQMYYPPYAKGCHFLDILNRTQSMHFILN